MMGIAFVSKFNKNIFKLLVFSKIFGFVEFYEYAIVNEGQAISELFCFFEVVSGEEDGEAFFVE